jgi:hypothetical protein
MRDVNVARVADTVSPIGLLTRSIRAPSCFDNVLTMVVPRPASEAGALPISLPTPLSETVSFQSNASIS